MFKFYLYNDQLDARLDAEAATAVLHIGQYYGAPRLVGLCERMLAREIRHRDAGEEGARQLHATAREAACSRLGVVAFTTAPQRKAAGLLLHATCVFGRCCSACDFAPDPALRSALAANVLR